ncbi:hypothetical protein HF313_25205 [Massilia atriviolacea]|uniref:HEAT repeat domain-containing protein n=1 Tax=Massilia atriviolacea TaxID=2495579 RepID=A0A430HNE9_9BURK|nr:hypothetical protein [Massilia atriviolacea]RSZ59021.1 hypothetical protein EJB06_11875 [Massilia atriviolacea]
MSSTFEFPIITPLIVRHASDSSFYWTQLEKSLASVTFDFNRVSHFNRLLDAHLDGLFLAKKASWPIAFKALERWKKGGEAFSAAYCAIQNEAPDELDQVLRIITQRPEDLIRGVVSAFTRAPQESVLPIIKLWSGMRMGAVAQVVALRAANLIGNRGISALDSPLENYFASASPYVRAAACRLAANFCDGKTHVNNPSQAARKTGEASGMHLRESHDGLSTLLQQAIMDSDLCVRAEASIALSKHGDRQRSLPILRECIVALDLTYSEASGWNRMQMARRLKRWTRELAWLSPTGALASGKLLSVLSPRTALTFALCQGDLGNTAFVVAQMTNPTVDRYAGWVWQALTGIDLAASGWVLEDSSSSAAEVGARVTEGTHDAENGLPKPDHAAVSAYEIAKARYAGQGKRVLLGSELSFERAVALLETGPQAVRILAAQVVNETQSVVRFSVRATAREQRISMERIRSFIAEKVSA